MERMIQTLMLKEHENLDSLLEKFKGDSSNMGLFNKFKWNLEKHFFMEEKAIFDLYNKIKGEDIPIIFDLMEQHGRILELVKDVEDAIDGERIEDIEELKNLLISHRQGEDRDFYPELDEDLTPEQKIEMKKRIEDHLRG